MSEPSPSPPSAPNPDRILVGVTGSIAAFKSAQLVSDLKKRGWDVQAILTGNARQFVGEATFEALSHRPVLIDLFDFTQTHRPEHIDVALHARLMVIAPATANFLGKVAHGLADDLLSSVVLAARCPVLVCPAMNDRMWTNPLVQENVAKLRRTGFEFCGPEEGYLADGYEAIGRLAEVDKILAECERLLGSP